MNDDWSDEQTDNPLYADDRSFYKVERWTKDGLHITDLLYAGNDLERAREIFTTATKGRPLALYHPPTHSRAGQLAGKVEQERRGPAHRRQHRQAAGAGYATSRRCASRRVKLSLTVALPLKERAAGRRPKEEQRLSC